MRALSNLATTQLRMTALAALMALASTLGCASGSCHGDNYRSAACRVKAARETLAFGLSREEALDAIGRSEVEPPWKNRLGLGPATISNPFDSQTFTSPIGEEYEVVRFFVEAAGNPRCPFVKGELKFEPLIFVDDKLVGWKWSYLAEVLGRRLTPKETGWDFGAFCDGQRASPPDANPSEPAPPDTAPSDANPSESAPPDTAPFDAGRGSFNHASALLHTPQHKSPQLEWMCCIERASLDAREVWFKSVR